jgi:glycosyltransferase 2 family protein
LKNTLKYLLPISLGFGLLYWVFKDINLLSTLQSFKDANYFLVFLAGLIALSAHISRAYRFNLMINAMGYVPTLKNSTVSILIGYITNLVFPRAGELARPASLLKTEGIHFEKSFGAVIAERLIDVIMLGILVMLNLVLEFDRVKSLVFSLVGEKFNNPYLYIYLLLPLFIIFTIGYFLFKKNQEKIQEILFFKKLITFLSGLWSGFSSVLKVEKPFLFLFHTILIWALYYLSTYILCKAVPLGNDMSLLTVLTIFVMGSIGMAAPTMGGIGSYHFLVGKIVVLYGLTAQEGINIATFLHTMQGIVFVVLLGAIAFLLNVLSVKKTSLVD